MLCAFEELSKFLYLIPAEIVLQCCETVRKTPSQKKRERERKGALELNSNTYEYEINYV